MIKKAQNKVSRKIYNPRSILMPALLAAALPGCVSLSAEPPPALLVLTADNNVAAGTIKAGQRADALVVLTPQVPRKLATSRLPVQVTGSSIAYLKNAVWADKPAVLLQQLMSETIAAKNDRLVLNNIDAGGKDREQLSGMLLEFGIQADQSEAVIVFDAVQHRAGQPIKKRRFEARESLFEINADDAGEALNKAANRVAEQVADWLAPQDSMADAP